MSTVDAFGLVRAKAREEHEKSSDSSTLTVELEMDDKQKRDTGIVVAVIGAVALVLSTVIPVVLNDADPSPEEPGAVRTVEPLPDDDSNTTTHPDPNPEPVPVPEPRAGDECVSAGVGVGARLCVSPASGPRGGSIEITGENFPPNASFYLQHPLLGAEHVVANDTGNFSAKFETSNTVCAPYTIGLYDQNQAIISNITHEINAC